MGDRQGSATARRHGISTSLLFRWRRQYRRGRLDGGPERGGFVAAVVVPEAPPGTVPQGVSTGRMEIVAHGGRRVIVDAGVDAAALARVLAVLEGR